MEDDDDLMSLDFTVPGAFDTKPGSPAAPEIPEAPSPPAPVRQALPAALQEAATMHAAGRELEAMRRLESAIKTGEDLGDAAVRAWGGLFELLQALGRRPAFDALALTFALVDMPSNVTPEGMLVGGVNDQRNHNHQRHRLADGFI